MSTTPTKTQRAISEIRARILNRDLLPGEPLRQSELAGKMRLGITPVREALLQLASEGLVTKIPYVGVVVADMTSESAHHIYETRRLLESYAAHQACLKATHADIAHLWQLFGEMDAAQARGDHEEYKKLNQAFHMTIYGLCGNPVLHEIIIAQWRRFPRDTLMVIEHQMSKSLEEHRKIISALERRDAASVEALMAAHIAGVEYEVAAYVTDRRPADGARQNAEPSGATANSETDP